MPAAETRAYLIRYLNPAYRQLSLPIVANVLDQLRARRCVSGRVAPPAWIDEPPVAWPPRELLTTRNQIVHLPSLAAGLQDYMRPATPRLFTMFALDYDVDANAAAPAAWLEFLNQLWPDDPTSIETLQEWFGYSLTPDTSQQKIALLIGPKRSGKGTIARVLRGLLGSQNVAGPTLASLGQNFGLAPLLGKPLAIVSDARLGGRTDSAVVTERLLSISGEDSLTIDQKYLPALTCQLPTRLMILTNELPRLNDSSGAPCEPGLSCCGSRKASSVGRTLG